MDYHSQSFSVKFNLDELKKRLQKGMVIKGRIIDCAKKNRYILRVWNYNIYTESKKKFEKNDIITMTVKEINPNLVFDMTKEEKLIDTEKKKTNILI